MINKGTRTVIRREVKMGLNKAFVFSTIFIPIVMAAIVATQTILAGLETDGESNITIVTEQDSQLQFFLKESLDQLELVQNGLFKITYKEIEPNAFDAFLESEKEALLADDYRSIFVVPNTIMEDKKVIFYSANPSNADVRAKISTAVNKALNLHYFKLNNVENIDIKFIQTDVSVNGVKVTKTGNEAESWGPLILGGTLALLLLLGVMFNSVPIMTIVSNEKASRVYEILLSSLKPRDILWGKVIGTTIIATLQMLIWIIALVILIAMLKNFVHSDAFNLNLEPVVIIYYLINYVTGLVLFLAIYAGLSSPYDNAGDASTALWPIYFIILIPFYTVFALLSNPANSVATALSLAPITSFYVMPARMALIDVPIWQPVLALLLNMILVYFSIAAAGKIYRMSVLSTGNSPSLRQLFIMMRQA